MNDLVKKIANKMKWTDLPKDDILIAGYEGLEIAKERFNPNKGASFYTFASYWIEKRIREASLEYGKLIRLSQKVQLRIWKILKVKKDLKQILGRKPSIEEIGEKLKMNKKEIAKNLKYDKISKVILTNNHRAIDEKQNISRISKEADYKKLTREVLKYLTKDEQISVANYFGFEIPNIKTSRGRTPTEPKIQRIIEKIRKNPQIMQILTKNRNLMAS